MRVHNKRELYARRKELRTRATPQEAKLWKRLRRKGLGVRFRRQQSIGWYILDFYCPEKRLAVEVDGRPHRGNKAYDKDRTEYLKVRGVTILRFWDDEVEKNLEEIVQAISAAVSPSLPLT